MGNEPHDTVDIVRRRLADGRTIADSDVRRLVAEVERLRAALRSVFMSRDHDEVVTRAGDAIGWSVVRGKPA